MGTEWTMYYSFTLALWTALEGGVFKAFSEFVMAGLQSAKPSAGIESMQHINRVVLRTEFVASLFALSVLGIALSIMALLSIQGSARFLIVAAAGTYIVGVFFVTVFGNVPMNEKLDKLDHTSKAAANYWQDYGQKWTRLNHIRTLSSIASAGVYLVSGVTLGLGGLL